MSEHKPIPADGSNVVTPQTERYLGYAGNHEVKLLVALFLADAADDYRPAAELENGFRDFIDVREGPQPNKTAIRSFCENSLIPGGQVDKAHTLGVKKAVIGYRLTEEGVANIPYVGLLLGWSITNNDTSLQRILGPSLGSEQLRAPTSRLRVLSPLVASPHAPVALTDIVPADDARHHNDYININNAANRLQDEGFIRIHRSTREGSPLFEIIQPDRIMTSRSKEIGLIVGEMYAFYRYWVSTGRQRFSINDCVAYVVDKVHAHDPQIPGADIRRTVKFSLLSRQTVNKGQYRFFPNIRRLQEDPTYIGRVEAVLEEDHREGLTSFMSIIAAMDSHDPAMRKRGSQAAASIAADGDLRRALYQKARLFSPAYNKREQVRTKREIASILGSMAMPVNAATVLQAYEAEHGRSFSAGYITFLLRQMRREGTVIVEKRPLGTYSNREQNVFSLAGN